MTEREQLVRAIAIESPRLIERLTAKRSLRQLGRECGLSPTFLSMVKNGRVPLCLSTFLLLADLDLSPSEEPSDD